MYKKILKALGILLLLCLIIAGYFVFQIAVQHQKLTSGTLQAEFLIDTIPFTYASTGHILVEAEINESGMKDLFILDSGAPNFLFSNYLEQHPLPTNGKALGRGAAGNYYLSNILKINSLRFGNLRFSNLHAKARAVNFSCLSDVSGIIGIGSMRHLTWQIDFRKQQIFVSQDPTRLPYSKEAIKIPLDRNKSSYHLRVPISMSEMGTKKNVLIDLGSNGILGLKEDYILQNSSNLNHKVIFGNAREGFGGVNTSKTQEKFYLFDSLFLNGTVFGIDSIPVLSSPNGLDLLGLGFFKKYKTTISWQNETLTLEPYDSVQHFVWKTPGFGTKYDRVNQQVIVKTVIDNSPAHRVGLIPGDEILSINGNEFPDEGSYCEHQHLGSSGDNVQVRIKQSDAIREFILIKQPIF